MTTPTPGSASGAVTLNWTASSGANLYTVKRSTLTYNGGGTTIPLNTIILTNSVTGTISVGTGPFGVAVSPDGTRAYTANFGAGTVSVINTLTNTVIGSPIPVGADRKSVV